MENNNTNYIQKPIFDGELESAEYEAVVVKATPMEAKGTMPASIRVMFKIEFPTCVAFVSGFINQTFKSGDKTSNWLKNLGVATMDNRVPVEQLKGKKCRIYVVPGKKAFSVKLGKEIQYHKILSLTPMNKVIPNVMSATQPAQQVPTQAPVQMVQPTMPVQQPVQQNPFLQQQTPAVKPVYAVPQANYAQPVQQPQVQPVQQPQVAPSIAAQLAQFAQPSQPVQTAPQPVQPTVQTAPKAEPVQPAVQQPLPTQPVSLDF